MNPGMEEHLELLGITDDPRHLGVNVELLVKGTAVQPVETEVQINGAPVVDGSREYRINKPILKEGSVG